VAVALGSVAVPRGILGLGSSHSAGKAGARQVGAERLPAALATLRPEV
jgi:hypothetical protein